MSLFTILLILVLAINGAVQLTTGFSKDTKNFWFLIAMGMAVGSIFTWI